MLLSCATSKLNTINESVILTIYNNDTNNYNIINLNVTELKLRTYENNRRGTVVIITFNEKEYLNFNYSLSDSKLTINNIIISEKWDGSIQDYLSQDGNVTISVYYRITNDTIEFIKKLQSINVIEEVWGYTRNITKFNNYGSLDNITRLNNNYISTLNAYLNTHMVDTLIFLNNNKIEYEIEKDKTTIQLHIMVNRISYITLFYNEYYNTNYPLFVSFYFEGNTFNQILPHLLTELGNPNSFTDYANHLIGWDYSNISILFSYSKNNFTIISLFNSEEFWRIQNADS